MNTADLIVGLLLCMVSVAYLAYEAGRDAGARALWQAEQIRDEIDAARRRHPSRLP